MARRKTAGLGRDGFNVGWTEPQRGCRDGWLGGDEVVCYALGVLPSQGKRVWQETDARVVVVRPMGTARRAASWRGVLHLLLGVVRGMFRLEYMVDEAAAR